MRRSLSILLISALVLELFPSPGRADRGLRLAPQPGALLQTQALTALARQFPHSGLTGPGTARNFELTAAVLLALLMNHHPIIGGSVGYAASHILTAGFLLPSVRTDNPAGEVPLPKSLQEPTPSPFWNYFIQFKRAVGLPSYKKATSIASGGVVSDVLYATNAREIVLIDAMPWTTREEDKNVTDLKDLFMDAKAHRDYRVIFGEGKEFPPYLAGWSVAQVGLQRSFLYDLMRFGISPADVQYLGEKDGAHLYAFDWAYPGERSVRRKAHLYPGWKIEPLFASRSEAESLSPQQLRKLARKYVPKAAWRSTILFLKAAGVRNGLPGSSQFLPAYLSLMTKKAWVVTDRQEMSRTRPSLVPPFTLSRINPDDSAAIPTQTIRALNNQSRIWKFARKHLAERDGYGWRMRAFRLNTQALAWIAAAIFGSMQWHELYPLAIGTPHAGPMLSMMGGDLLTQLGGWLIGAPAIYSVIPERWRQTWESPIRSLVQRQRDWWFFRRHSYLKPADFDQLDGETRVRAAELARSRVRLGRLGEDDWFFGSSAHHADKLVDRALATIHSPKPAKVLEIQEAAYGGYQIDGVMTRLLYRKRFLLQASSLALSAAVLTHNLLPLISVPLVMLWIYGTTWLPFDSYFRPRDAPFSDPEDNYSLFANRQIAARLFESAPLATIFARALYVRGLHDEESWEGKITPENRALTSRELNEMDNASLEHLADGLYNDASLPVVHDALEAMEAGKTLGQALDEAAAAREISLMMLLQELIQKPGVDKYAFREEYNELHAQLSGEAQHLAYELINRLSYEISGTQILFIYLNLAAADFPSGWRFSPEFRELLETAATQVSRRYREPLELVPFFERLSRVLMKAVDATPGASRYRRYKLLKKALLRSALFPVGPRNPGGFLVFLIATALGAIQAQALYRLIIGARHVGPMLSMMGGLDFTQVGGWILAAGAAYSMIRRSRPRRLILRAV